LKPTPPPDPIVANDLCECGPTCECPEKPCNPNCLCKKCRCDKEGKESALSVIATTTIAVADEPKKQAAMAPEKKPEPIGDYESHRIKLRLVTADWCPACVRIKNETLPALRKSGWKIGYDEQQHIRYYNPYGTIPRWEREVDGVVVERRVGFMTPAQVDKFLTGGKEPKRRAK